MNNADNLPSDVFMSFMSLALDLPTCPVCCDRVYLREDDDGFYPVHANPTPDREDCFGLVGIPRYQEITVAAEAISTILNQRSKVIANFE
jgi:hypothetical protein